MGFAIPFDLSNLRNGFPLHAGAGIVSGNRLTSDGGFGKHIALGDIRVVGYGNKAAIGTLCGVRKPLP